MLYTELTKKAMRIAYEAHSGQYDRGGVPYVFHPYQVAQKMETEAEVCVALLHDVLEDTDYTREQLLEAGFTEEILSAVDILTKPDSVDYMDYIRRVRENSIAVKVKLADIEHNSDETRVDDSDEALLRRRKKYDEARRLLMER